MVEVTNKKPVYLMFSLTWKGSYPSWLWDVPEGI
jgi:hypothetical protein